MGFEDVKYLDRIASALETLVKIEREKLEIEKKQEVK